MTIKIRKKSPKYPSMNLEDAISRALRVYKEVNLHPVASDIAAEHGLCKRRSGASLTTIASMSYFGLLERTDTGMLCVSRDLEAYNFSPSENEKFSLLKKWLLSPQVFSEILDRYSGKLPSDAAIRHTLMQNDGFKASAADTCIKCLRDSIAFIERQHPDRELFQSSSSEPMASTSKESEPALEISSSAQNNLSSQAIADPLISDADRIPVRLQGGRKAWLEIPNPFYEQDKKQLVAQIELLLCDDH